MDIQDLAALATPVPAVECIRARAVEHIQAQAVVHTRVPVVAHIQVQAVEHIQALVEALTAALEARVIQGQVAEILINGTGLLNTVSSKHYLDKSMTNLKMGSKTSARQLAEWIVVVVLLMGSGLASASWVWYSSTEAGSTLFYDPETIKKIGKGYKVWTLSNSVIKDSLSHKSLIYIDCSNETKQQLFSSFYSRENGEGAVVYSSSEQSSGEPIVPESTMGALFKKICKNRR